ncbi:MAG: hypothetical protein KDM91_05910 [Verrucomicrobiae bacterium]|nr:hypothetical protein [Verrucomicrobiae bacterium]MCP5539167.1 hypothetical protein [Akkermansiaceae bacterium]MCP5549818.1 hypothetical protein [Akkermansiaceae bacterium]
MSRRRPPQNSAASPGRRSTGNRVLKGVLIGGALMLVVLFVAVFGLTQWLENYRNSEKFRAWLAGRVAEKLKAEVELPSFKWEGSSVFADGFRSRGYEDAAQARLDLDGLRASFGGIADQAWQIPEITVNRLSLEFSRDRLAGAWDDRPTAASGPAPAPEGPAWLRRFVPEKISLGEIRVDAANVAVLNERKDAVFALDGVRGRLAEAAGSGWDIDATGGRMRVVSQPEMKIERFSLRWQPAGLFIHNATLEAWDGARLDGDGVVKTGKDGVSLELQIDLDNLDVKKIAGPDWSDKLSGIVFGNVRLAGKPGALVQSGTLNLKDGELTGLPVLEKVSQYTKNPRFKRLPLNETRADFERTGDRVVLTNIVIQSNGLSRLEGSLVIDGRAIEGDLHLGVTPGTLQWIPGAEQKVFVRSDRGFLWTPVKVAGTLDQPREDLSARLVSAAAETIVEEIPGKAIDTAKEALKNPTQAPATVIEEGKKLIDTFVPLFK